MKSASLLGILLELLEELGGPGDLPADARVGRFFRARRYLGAKDRRVIGGLAYGWLRHRPRGEARWDTWAAGEGLPRSRDLGGREAPVPVLLALARDGLLPWTSGELAGAARDLLPAGEPWSALLDRATRAEALGPQAWPDDPGERLAAELSLPPWIALRFVEERGEQEARRLGELLLREAPVDLRVNVSRVAREEARAALEQALGPEQGPVAPTPFSPVGLRLPGRRNLGAFLTGHPGWIEVQDEGSQLVALAADPRPDETVLDACAGAGGKTLALIDLRDARGGSGVLHAADISADRLEELRRRAAAMGARRLSVHPLGAEGPLPSGLPSAADLVLVDAPCSGSGALRRSPELKLRYGPADLTRFAALQGAILERFAPLVRPGGRLVYATCSLFREENEAVVERFLRERPEFVERSLPAGLVLPAGAVEGGRLRLDPVITGTDGFFVAVLRRRP